MRREIPAPVISVVAEFVSSHESHATLDSLFAYADAPGDPPPESKHAKALAWLRRTNKTQEADPLSVLGKIVENYMDRLVDPDNDWDKNTIEFRAKFTRLLANAGLTYQSGGRVIPLVGSSTRALADFIRDRDFGAVDTEFQRAIDNTEKNPREAVSAAANILESVCKIYIEDEGLEMPSKQDLQNVWNPVRKHLGFDPAQVEDQDLQKILSGLLSVVHGVGALRTHSSSAHGAGRRVYRLEPRHARLAIHSAHTLTLFILESWAKKENVTSSNTLERKINLTTTSFFPPRTARSATASPAFRI